MELVEISEEKHKKIQQLELKILEEFDGICRQYQLEYTIAYGSLLGAVRHGGFIPWDDDIDVCMLRKDYIRFREICKKELSSKFFYQSHETDHEYYYLMDKIRMNDTIFRESFVSRYPIHHGVYIDIFPMDKLPNNIMSRFFQYLAFHFCRIGLQSKYLLTEARRGKKRIAAIIMRILYAPFSMDYLYRKSHEIASKYDNNSNCKQIACFFSPYKRKDVYDVDMMLKIERRKFESIMVSAVVNYDDMLTRLYGDYMKLPPLKDRETKHTVTELKI